MNPLVSKVHGKEKHWKAEFAALRALCLAAGLNEELKWGQACYDLGGANMVLIHDPPILQSAIAPCRGRAGENPSATRFLQGHGPATLVSNRFAFLGV